MQESIEEEGFEHESVPSQISSPPRSPQQPESFSVHVEKKPLSPPSVAGNSTVNMGSVVPGAQKPAFLTKSRLPKTLVKTQQKAVISDDTGMDEIKKVLDEI